MRHTTRTGAQEDDQEIVPSMGHVDQSRLRDQALTYAPERMSLIRGKSWIYATRMRRYPWNASGM